MFPDEDRDTSVCSPAQSTFKASGNTRVWTMLTKIMAAIGCTKIPQILNFLKLSFTEHTHLNLFTWKQWQKNFCCKT